MRRPSWTLLVGAFAVVVGCAKAYLGDDPSVNLPNRSGAGATDAAASAHPDGAVSSSVDGGALSLDAGGGGDGGGGGGDGDGSSPGETTPPPPPTRSPGVIECGPAQCSGGAICCLSLSAQLSCAGSCSIASIGCDEPADCTTGNRCCSRSGGGGTVGTDCRQSCGTDYVVCVSDADCDPGKHCVAAPAPIPAPYKFCQ